MERITGGILAGGLYIFGTTYLVGPLFGWHISSETMVAAFGALPVAAKVAAKFCVAWPFTFHLFTGTRYLVTSFAKTLNNKPQMIRIGWAVSGVSTVSALILALM